MGEQIPENVIPFQEAPLSACRIAFGFNKKGQLTFAGEGGEFAQKFLLYSFAQEYLDAELKIMKANGMQSLRRSA